MSHRLYKNFVRKSIQNRDSHQGYVIVEKIPVLVKVKTVATQNNKNFSTTITAVTHHNSLRLSLYQGPDVGWEQLRDICSEKIRLHTVSSILIE